MKLLKLLPKSENNDGNVPMPKFEELSDENVPSKTHSTPDEDCEEPTDENMYSKPHSEPIE